MSSTAEVRAMLDVALVRSIETQLCLSKINEDLGQVRPMSAQVIEKLEAVALTPLGNLAAHVETLNAVLVNMTTIEVQGMAPVTGQAIEACDYALNAAAAALDGNSYGYAAVTVYREAANNLEQAHRTLVDIAAKHTEVYGSSTHAAIELMSGAQLSQTILQSLLETAYTALLTGDQLIKNYMATL